jgi:hypothetical protein
VILVIVLRFFVAEDNVESDLVWLVNDGAVALRGAADMELENTRDRFEVFVGASDQFVSGVGKSGFGPKNDNVRKHGRTVAMLRKLSRGNAAPAFELDFSGALAIIFQCQLRDTGRMNW